MKTMSKPSGLAATIRRLHRQRVKFEVGYVLADSKAPVDLRITTDKSNDLLRDIARIVYAQLKSNPAMARSESVIDLLRMDVARTLRAIGLDEKER